MADKECFLSEEEYHTNLLKTKLEISPALLQKSGKHPESKIKEKNKLVDPMCKTKTTKSKEESFSHDAEYHTNLLKTKLEISPALFQKSGKHFESKIQEIHELVDTMCKKKPTKSKEESFSKDAEYHTNWLKRKQEISPALCQKSEKHTETKIKEMHELVETMCKTKTTKSKEADSSSHEKVGQTNSLQNWLQVSPGLYSKSGKSSESKIKERHGLADKTCKTRTTKSKGILPRFTRSETMKKRKLAEVDAAV